MANQPKDPKPEAELREKINTEMLLFEKEVIDYIVDLVKEDREENIPHLSQGYPSSDSQDELEDFVMWIANQAQMYVEGGAFHTDQVRQRLKRSYLPKTEVAAAIGDSLYIEDDGSSKAFVEGRKYERFNIQRKLGLHKKGTGV